MKSRRIFRASVYWMAAACVIPACASVRYPNWSAVRIEPRVPRVDCEHVAQESCPTHTATEGCHNWYKKRASTYPANVVVLRADIQGVAEYFMCPDYVPAPGDDAPRVENDEAEIL